MAVYLRQWGKGVRFTFTYDDPSPTVEHVYLGCKPEDDVLKEDDPSEKIQGALLRGREDYGLPPLGPHQSGGRVVGIEESGDLGS